VGDQGQEKARKHSGQENYGKRKERWWHFDARSVCVKLYEATAQFRKVQEIEKVLCG
jgi:hypothetical protein